MTLKAKEATCLVENESISVLPESHVTVSFGPGWNADMAVMHLVQRSRRVNGEPQLNIGQMSEYAQEVAQAIDDAETEAYLSTIS